MKLSRFVLAFLVSIVGGHVPSVRGVDRELPPLFRLEGLTAHLASGLANVDLIETPLIVPEDVLNSADEPSQILLIK